MLVELRFDDREAQLEQKALQVVLDMRRLVQDGKGEFYEKEEERWEIFEKMFPQMREELMTSAE